MKPYKVVTGILLGIAALYPVCLGAEGPGYEDISPYREDTLKIYLESPDSSCAKCHRGRETPPNLPNPHLPEPERLPLGPDNPAGIG
jgi:hypothetical protein